MFNGLRLENFRAFEFLNIDLSKINIFVGPNNSGKSSILSSINLLSQTLRSADKETPLILHGEKENLGTYEDMVYNNDINRDVTIGLRCRYKNPTGIKQFNNSSPNEILWKYKFGYRKMRRQIILKSTEVIDENNIPIIKTHYNSNTEKQVIDVFGKKLAIGEKISQARVPHRWLNFQFFPVPTFLFDKRKANVYEFRYEGKLGSLREISYEIYKTLVNAEYISPFRISPERTYMFTGESPKFVGAHGEKTISILVADWQRKGEKKKGIIQNISKFFRKSGIAEEFNITPIGDRHFEIRLKHISSGEDENLMDVGFGCSQILPVLTAGYNLSKGECFVLEQPEIHLHPKAQAEVGDYLCGLVKNRQLQLFVETHSEHLILRLQSHVASGTLKPSDIAVYYVYSKKGKKTVKRLELNEDGYFITEWPEGFFPERLNEAKKIAKANLAKKND